MVAGHHIQPRGWGIGDHQVKVEEVVAGIGAIPAILAGGLRCWWGSGGPGGWWGLGREGGWGEVGADASSSMSVGPEGAGGDSTSMAEAWGGGSTSMVDVAGGRLGREAGGLGSSRETFPAWAVVMVVPRLTGGGLVLTMVRASNGCRSNRRLRHRAACEERTSKQKGIGEGKDREGGGSISLLKKKLPWTEKETTEGGEGR